MKIIVLFLFLSMIVVSCSSNEESALVSENGNGSSDSDNIEMKSLVVVDSIGLELGDPNYVFGSIEAIDRTANGNILLLDRPACSVIEYTPAGEFVQRMGRQGSGPGEFNNPLSMTRLGDGRVAVLDPNRGGFFTFFEDGTYEAAIMELLGEPILWITPSIENTFVGTLNSWDQVNDEFVVTAVIGRFDVESGDPVTTYWETSFAWDFQDITVLMKGSYFARTWTSNRDGYVFVAPRSPEDYIINGFTAEGSPTITIEMDVEQVAKTDEEIAEEAFFWNTRARNMGANGPFNYQPDDYRWMIHSMGIDGENRLWVRRGTEETPTFDVFDFDGNYLFKAELDGVGGPDGLFWEIKIDEFGILAYSLDPADGYQKLYMLEIQ